jgi:hypothetical protein
VHRLPREVLRKGDRHRTSTKFRLGVRSGLFSSGFPTKILYTFLVSQMRATWPCYHSFHDCITITVFGESRDGSVGIVLGDRLEDRGFRVQFPAWAGNFSLHQRVQNGSGAHPAYGYQGLFPGGKAAWA